MCDGAGEASTFMQQRHDARTPEAALRPAIMKVAECWEITPPVEAPLEEIVNQHNFAIDEYGRVRCSVPVYSNI